jgi:hypothetical protein
MKVWFHSEQTLRERPLADALGEALTDTIRAATATAGAA